MKKWYHSKTIWVNAIAFIAIFAQAYAGFIISPEEQMGVLAVINLVLRIITHEGLYEKTETEQ